MKTPILLHYHTGYKSHCEGYTIEASVALPETARDLLHQRLTIWGLIPEGGLPDYILSCEFYVDDGEQQEIILFGPNPILTDVNSPNLQSPRPTRAHLTINGEKINPTPNQATKH
jgi:hypothetical protein